jgi:hypothetical protein
LATPHRGTWLARFSATNNGKQMRMGSGWLDELTKLEGSSGGALFVCYHSNCDNIVFPASSATLPGADNRSADGLAMSAWRFTRGDGRDSFGDQAIECRTGQGRSSRSR